MKLVKYLRWLVLVLPLGFFLLDFLYRDSSYVVFAVITLLLSVVVLVPNILSGLTFKFPNKKSSHKVKSTKISTPTLKLSILSNNKKLFVIVATLLFVVYFTIISAINLHVVPSVRNLILEYYASQILSLKSTGIYLVLLLIGISLAGSSLTFLRENKKFSFAFNKKLFINRILLGLATTVVALFISLVSTYLLAIAQVNSAVIALDSAPSTVGVLYGKDAINNKLKSMTAIPQIVGAESNIANTILSVVINGSSKQNSFYQTRIIKTLPSYLIIPFNVGNQSVIMVNNTLIITSIDKDAMQTLSSTIARILLKNYFKDRNLKDNPKITILNRQEYLAFRQDEINKQETKIQTAIQKVNDYLSSMQSDAYTSQQKINTDQGIVDNAQSQESSAYNNCMNYGYTDYFTGQFISYYTQSYCSSLRDQWAQVVSQGNQDISQLNDELSYDNGQITESQNAIQALNTYMQSVDAQKTSTPDELGIFEGPNNVRVVLDSTSPKGIDDFLETLVHENLHYQSYVSTDRNFQFSDGSYDGFWEEGLTEYFARKVIATDLGVNVNEGYPLIVKIVAQIAKKIPESELQQIYFTKDESGLEAALNTAYGNNFYKDSELYFETLSYLPDNQQLKIANNIMTRIDGPQLTSKDLYSTDMQQQ